ncbi:MAG: sigma factor-like helix-turn-helix DNA-binding protein [Alphaproteobacteria bacterium]
MITKCLDGWRGCLGCDVGVTSPLEDKDKEIFRLKGEGKNGKEIATILGLSESTVSRRLQKAA